MTTPLPCHAQWRRRPHARCQPRLGSHRHHQHPRSARRRMPSLRRQGLHGRGEAVPRKGNAAPLLSPFSLTSFRSCLPFFSHVSLELINWKLKAVKFIFFLLINAYPYLIELHHIDQEREKKEEKSKILPEYESNYPRHVKPTLIVGQGNSYLRLTTLLCLRATVSQIMPDQIALIINNKVHLYIHLLLANTFEHQHLSSQTSTVFFLLTILCSWLFLV